MKKLMLTAALLMAGVAAFADYGDINGRPWWTPLQINLASPLSLPWGERDVYGLKLNLLHGSSAEVRGLDVGLVGSTTRANVYGIELQGFNYVDGDMRGLQLGAVANYLSGGVCGVQLAGLVNWNVGEACGLQLGALNFDGGFAGLQAGVLNWSEDTFRGWGFGLINCVKNEFTGFEAGLLNYVKGGARGLQLGVFNIVEGDSAGLQLGLFNAADHHTGVQIGLLSLNKLGALPVFPIVNANFR